MATIKLDSQEAYNRAFLEWGCETADLEKRHDNHFDLHKMFELAIVQAYGEAEPPFDKYQCYAAYVEGYNAYQEGRAFRIRDTEEN